MMLRMAFKDVPVDTVFLMGNDVLKKVKSMEMNAVSLKGSREAYLLEDDEIVGVIQESLVT